MANTVRFMPTEEDRERARRTAEMVRLRLERREHAAAIAAIVRHREEIDGGRLSGQMSLTEAGLPMRTANMLEHAGIFTLGQLRDSPRTSWCNLWGMGETTITAIDTLLAALDSASGLSH